MDFVCVRLPVTWIDLHGGYLHAPDPRRRYSFTYTDTDAFKDALQSMLGISEFPRVAVQKKANDKKKWAGRKQGL